MFLGACGKEGKIVTLDAVETFFSHFALGGGGAVGYCHWSIRMGSKEFLIGAQGIPESDPTPPPKAMFRSLDAVCTTHIDSLLT